MRSDDLSITVFPSFTVFPSMGFQNCFIYDTLLLERCRMILYIFMGPYFWEVIRNVYGLLNPHIFNTV